MKQQRTTFYKTHTIMVEIFNGKNCVTVDDFFYGPFDLASCDRELKKIEGIYALPAGYLRQQISRIKTL